MEELLEHIGLAEWVADAIADSLIILPFLLVIFIFIELFEYYYSDKVKNFVKYAQTSGPVIGSLVSIIPQCGFSVIASTLYVRKYISMGTLIAIYLATSDEALPVLMAHPDKYKYILPIIAIKLVVAIPAGYLIDKMFKPVLRDIKIQEKSSDGKDIAKPSKRMIFFESLKHTANIFLFILVITLILNYIFNEEKIVDFYQNGVLLYKFIQPVITAVIGLIPNCAVSLAITVLMIKGTISFGAAMAGLLSNAGLGLLVLLRGGRLRSNIRIVVLLLMISIICGELLQLFTGWIK